MTVSTAKTEKFITEQLPAMVLANGRDILSAYPEYLAQVKDLVGDTYSDPSESDFDWHSAYEAVDEHHGDQGETRHAIARVAATNCIITGGFDLRSDGFSRLHGDEGSFALVSAADGRLIGAADVYNPCVDASYGNGTPYIFNKIGLARLVESIQKQGADWGEGYEVASAFQRNFGLLKDGASLHIGMATLHALPYDPLNRRVDRHALGYGAATGRTLLPTTRQWLVQNRPDIASRMVNGIDGTADPDDLAGLLDTWSATLALKAAIHKGDHLKERPYTFLPYPNHLDNRDVDWN